MLLQRTKGNQSRIYSVEAIGESRKRLGFLDTGIHNGFNYGPCAIIVATDDRRDFEIQQAEWGYIPGSAKDRAKAKLFRLKYTTLNFKGENLFKKEDGKPSMWADAGRKRRCLVLSTGLVESMHMPTYGIKGQLLIATEKIPYQVGVIGKEYFWFAGVYNDWFDKEAQQWVRTVAFATTSANLVMQQIHNSKKRMPTILTDNLAWEWLMEEPSEARLTEIALTQIPSKLMEACTIDKNYRFAGEATPVGYPDHPLDLTFVDQEKLDFDYWRVS